MTDPQSQNEPVLKITLEDLEAVTPAESNTASPAAGEKPSVYGSVYEPSSEPVMAEEKGSLWLQGWLYLGAAGLIGALAAWAICEPAFVDDGPRRWGNLWLLPLIVAMMGIAFAVAESLVERSPRKGWIRAGIALPLGILFGFVFDTVANLIYNIGIHMVAATGAQTLHNPGFWIARGLGWAAFGVAGGLLYGILGRSGKKAGYGALGGAIGAMLGGVIFDPIAFATKGGAPSRAIGFALLGLATGVAMGLVESALKDRWLYVTAGPLAGKQFILYKPVTQIGSSQQSDIYLFKDAEILPTHATLQLKGPRMYLTPNGDVYADGAPLRAGRALESGTNLRIGRYGFRYQERQR